MTKTESSSAALQADSSPAENASPDSLAVDYAAVRARSREICAPLCTEDYVVQPCAEVSPPKWHLAHTTWFFEEAVLSRFQPDYVCYNEAFRLLFNSYYKSAGKHWSQGDRGQLSRPTVDEVLDYRQAIDGRMQALLGEQSDNHEMAAIVELGLHHEQQHQELLCMDIKTILGSNPTMPAYTEADWPAAERKQGDWQSFEEGIYQVGAAESGFSYDNERPRHRVFSGGFEMHSTLVSNADYQEFMSAGGYENAELWLSQGWDWLQAEQAHAPMYWFQDGEDWHYYTLHGARPVDPHAPVVHLSYFEADAYARWRGCRLPSEAELELWLANQGDGEAGEKGEIVHPRDVAAPRQVWQWTSSHYSAYPGYQPYAGMLGEYNGKFMCNQFVLRGGCVATPAGHYRHSYRNFFLPQQRWMFSGLRLARDPS